MRCQRVFRLGNWWEVPMAWSRNLSRCEPGRLFLSAEKRGKEETDRHGYLLSGKVEGRKRAGRAEERTTTKMRRHDNAETEQRHEEAKGLASAHARSQFEFKRNEEGRKERSLETNLGGGGTRIDEWQSLGFCRVAHGGGSLAWLAPPGKADG